MIDAHVHFWKYNKVKDAWINEEMKTLQQDFLPHQLEPLLLENGVKGIVAVQADQSENETEFLVGLANENSTIKGLVGWVDLQNEQVEERLEYFSQFNIIKGFRHIVQAEPDGFLLNKNFLKGIQLLQRFGFTYDILIHHKQLPEAIEFVDKFPGQKMIIDHCAKPEVKNKKIGEWGKLMKEIAQHKNVYCKLSGLMTEANWNEWDEVDFYPFLDVVFESFGTERLVFGSDWPVMLLSGTYAKWRQIIENYMSAFSPGEKQKVFGQNAIEFYHL